MSSLQSFDFIVVGAGPAGCVTASRLANSAAQPSVLLLEAGGSNAGTSHRVDADRWHLSLVPETNWGYVTIPQEHLDNRKIDYSRGKGLGGSTAINFSCYTVAPKADHDELARLVGDDDWRWENAQLRYKRIESYKAYLPDIPEGVSKYLNPKPEDHGHHGPLKIGFPRIWEPTMLREMDLFVEAGVPPNPDHNNGDPIGLAICANTAYRGERITALDIVRNAPKNLRIVTHTHVAKVIFEGRKAVGVQTLDGRKFLASKEVVLSTGSLDSPRILMHSGIGPSEQLQRHNISILHNSPLIGKNLQDHYHVNMAWERAAHTSTRPEYFRNKERLAAARREWETSRTGPLADIATQVAIGFSKSKDILESKEFLSLPKQVQAHLLQPTVPSYEFVLNAPFQGYFTDPENTPANSVLFMFLMNCQSRGTVSLQSSDPAVPLLFDPKFFSHPYDRRVAVQAYREMARIVKTPAFDKDTIRPISTPASESEDDILSYWRENATSTWHMAGTVKMGREGDPEACVDNHFRVLGVSNLRVADLSVLPLLTK
jgi:choline dehydrogenase-like flavoprotein